MNAKIIASLAFTSMFSLSTLLSPAHAEEQEKALNFGIISTESQQNLKPQWTPFLQDMEKKLGVKVECNIVIGKTLTVDELFGGKNVRQVPIIKGDAKSLSIAAASVIAKVTRDRMMVEYDRTYPGYGFASNKGYGSAAHIEALRTLGPTPIHRASFIKGLL
mgnify:CR=1 FL=1